MGVRGGMCEEDSHLLVEVVRPDLTQMLPFKPSAICGEQVWPLLQGSVSVCVVLVVFHLELTTLFYTNTVVHTTEALTCEMCRVEN